MHATFLLISTVHIFLLIRVSLVSNGEEPVKKKISDASTVSCLALTHSALFWIRPVSLDLRKALKDWTHAIAYTRACVFSIGNSLERKKNQG